MLELYESYIDYEDMMCFTEQLIHHISAKAAVPDTHLLRKQFTVLSIHSALQKYLSLSTDSISDVDHLCELLSNHGYSNAYNKLSLVQYEVFDKLVSPLIVEPTFIIGYPIELSPLAKASNENPDIAQRAELFYKGYELANLYSEQNDAELQRQALLKQNEILYDASYIEALKYGLPPCAGLGIGIDRLLMSIFDIEYIKDIILFPTLRPK
jgi:lysyl-tRNA synthetase class 2